MFILSYVARAAFYAAGLYRNYSAFTHFSQVKLCRHDENLFAIFLLFLSHMYCNPTYLTDKIWKIFWLYRFYVLLYLGWLLKCRKKRGFLAQDLTLRSLNRLTIYVWAVEKYPSGSRGSPAKGVVWDNRSAGSNPAFSAKWNLNRIRKCLV